MLPGTLLLVAATAGAAPPAVRVEGVADSELAAAVQSRAAHSLAAVQACDTGGRDLIVAFEEVSGRLEAYGGTREAGRCAAAGVATWPAAGLAGATGWVVFPGGAAPTGGGSLPPWQRTALLGLVDPPGDTLTVSGFSPLLAWQLTDLADRDRSRLLACVPARAPDWETRGLALAVQDGRVGPVGEPGGGVEACLAPVVAGWRVEGSAAGSGRLELHLQPEGLDPVGLALADAMQERPKPSATPPQRPPPPAPRGTVALVELVGREGPAAEAVRQGLTRHRAVLLACYGAALAEVPGAGGRLALALQLHKGHTVAARATADHTGAPGLAACVEAKVAQWSWPRPAGDGPLALQLAFTPPAAPGAP